MKKKIIILFLVLFILPITSINGEHTDTTKKQDNLPTSFNWRNINGVDYTTPIKDQSPAPTCEAYAICASLETQMQYQLGETYGPDLSEMHLYFYAGGTIAKGYVNLIDAANYLIQYGIPDEGCFPDPHRSFDYPYESLPDWENRTVKIQHWGWVDQDIESIKTALINNGPLVTCIAVWKDFLYYSSGVYKHLWGTRVGGHVITIVGYDDTLNCWICKNSWGTNWGEDGWFKMAYDADLFADWYGHGTGVMYINGVYGNFQPDVPKVQIDKPRFSRTYIFNKEFRYFFKKLPIQIAAARILGKLQLEITTENTNNVEFYIDDILKYQDETAPFTWELKTTRGLHTLEARANNDNSISIDVIDIYVF